MGVQRVGCVAGQRKRTPYVFLMKPKPTRFAAGLLGGLCALAAASCTADQVEPEHPAPTLMGVRYVQTQCADRWGQAPGTQALVNAARTYLAQQGLTLHQAQAGGTNTGAVCAACTCPTGLVLEGAVALAELPAVLALGFTQQ
jgi:putative hemolysin